MTNKRLRGSFLLKETRPEKGFFMKYRKKYFLLSDDKWHTKFSWEPVTVGDVWADEEDGRCQLHFMLLNPDGSTTQIDQPVSRQRYTLFKGYSLDAHRLDLIEKVLHENRTGLCIRKWPACNDLHIKVTDPLLDDLKKDAKICGHPLSTQCVIRLNGKRPRAAFTEEELDLLRSLKKERADVQLMFNAMIQELGQLPKDELLTSVINGKSFDWWREHLIRALEFFDKMRDRVAENAD